MSDFSSFESLTKADTTKLPGFFTIEAVQDMTASDREGRPIFQDVEFIRIIFPGDNTREINRPATDEDRTKYADEYRRFKEGNDQLFSGTPLSAWGALHASTVAELKSIRCYTVEQLAGLSEIGIGKLGMGARDMVAKAQAFLSRNTEADTLREQVRALEAKVAELSEQLAAEPTDKPRRGRPPKEVSNADAA